MLSGRLINSGREIANPVCILRYNDFSQKRDGCRKELNLSDDVCRRIEPPISSAAYVEQTPLQGICGT